MKVIAFSNQKGGVGKTVAAVNMAVSVGLKGKTVLVIDMDVQGNATSYLGLAPNSLPYDASLLLEDDNFPLSKSIVSTKYGVDLVPSNTTIGRANTTLVGVLGRETRLRDKIEAYSRNYANKQYDYIIIDCCPDLNIITTNALMAATDLVVPVQPKQFAYDGMTELSRKVGELYKRLDPQLKFMGVIISMYKEGVALDKVMVDLLREKLDAQYGEGYVFPDLIRWSTVVSESEKFGPLVWNLPDAPASVAYRNNALHMMAR